jgi:amino acid adenylation domain-containing protein
MAARATLVQDFLERSALRYPDKTALVTDEGRFTYREVEESANAVAHALLADGLAKGDRVAVFSDNSLKAVVALFGIIKAGGVFVVINPTTKAEKLARILNDCGAFAVVSGWPKLDVVGDAVAATPSVRRVYLGGTPASRVRNIGVPSVSMAEVTERPRATPPMTRPIDVDLAALIYTSGSTGSPKGVMMTHANMVSAADSITSFLENTSDDIILNTLPMSFDYGLYQVLMSCMVGGTVILDNAFLYPSAVVERLIAERVTGFPIVPTISSVLLQMEDVKRRRFDHLRYVTSTAAFWPVEHIVKLREMFRGAKLYSMYGLTECKRVSYLPPEELDKRPTSVGKSIPNTEAFVVDSHGLPVGSGVVGELVVRGSHVMRGYWNDPKETAKRLKPGLYPGESVLYTGDLFRTDDEGFLYFVARKDDIIKSRGEKVSPKEVEAILYGLDEVAEAAVVGVPDPLLGEAVKAVLALRQGATLTARQVIRHCAAQLEDFMVPKYVEFLDQLPHSSRGKIDRQRLKVKGVDS